MVVEVSRPEPWLVAQMTAQTEEYQFTISVFLLVDGKHYSVDVAMFAVSVDSIEYTCKCFREVSKIVGKTCVSSPALFFECQLHLVKLCVIVVHSLFCSVSL